MYVWDRLREDPTRLLKAVKTPEVAAMEVNRLYYQFRYGKECYPAGIDIFDEDWDNLIILDACRFEDYAELTPFEGTPEVRTSKGSASKQFIRGNFRGRTLHDLVYVSGNQWYLKLKDELDCELHKYFDVKRDAAGKRVPKPETLKTAALSRSEEFPNKRLLIHFMQPHRPFLGDRRALFTDESGDGGLEQRDIISTVRSGEASWEDAAIAYRDNLRIVLEEVESLVQGLGGKTVISSDHGELLGDRMAPIPARWYGHPSAIYIDKLVNIPWHVVKDGSRKEIISEPPDDELEVRNAGDVRSNLKNLGYL